MQSNTSSDENELDAAQLTIVVHDFAGHPCQIQLSRELARRGHKVQHQYCRSVTTGQGATARRENDPQGFSIRGVSLRSNFQRYSPVRRILQETRYGHLAARAIISADPNVAVLSNLPLIPLLIVARACKRRSVPYVLWWQDVYSDAIGSIARQRLGALGVAIAGAVSRLERRCARRAAAVVPITEPFVEILKNWDVALDKVTVVPNWAAVDEIDARPRNNSWARMHSLDSVKVVMYAGTLGLKHNPAVIVGVARLLPDDYRVVVISQGKGRQWLEENCQDVGNIVLLDYQPYSDLPDVLGSADLFLVILEEDASRYSVPSKILNYLCAGRPILALMPADNAAADMLIRSGAGAVVSPRDHIEVAEVVNRILSNDSLRTMMALNARDYAEKSFQISQIADEFERVILEAAVTQ